MTDNEINEIYSKHRNIVDLLTAFSIAEISQIALTAVALNARETVAKKTVATATEAELIEILNEEPQLSPLWKAAADRMDEIRNEVQKSGCDYCFTYPHETGCPNEKEGRITEQDPQSNMTERMSGF